MQEVESMTREHIEDVYAARIGVVFDEAQRYADRLIGTDTNGQRVVVLIRIVGADNAGRFRRWVTYRKSDFESMITRPIGWRYYTLMLGLLPDGSPWWSALYDETHLRQPDVYEHAEQVIRGLYRFDPGLAAPALVAEHDFTRPGPVPEPFMYAFTVGDESLTTSDPNEFTDALREAVDAHLPIRGEVLVAAGQLTLNFE